MRRTLWVALSRLLGALASCSADLLQLLHHVVLNGAGLIRKRWEGKAKCHFATPMKATNMCGPVAQVGAGVDTYPGMLVALHLEAQELNVCEHLLDQA